MPRPKCQRRIRHEPGATYFKPRGVPLVQLEEVVLTLDEVEALRLADHEQLYHEAAAERMNVSRATFGRIVEAARRKVAGALVNGHALRLKGGVVTMSDKRTFVCNDCGHRWEMAFGSGRPTGCPKCHSENFERIDHERGPDYPGGWRHRHHEHGHSGHGGRGGHHRRRHQTTATSSENKES